MEKIKSFTDLIAWKKAHKFALKIYKITSNFPKEEKYGLVDQMRRAAVSVTSNMAEGFGRRTFTDKNSFYYMSLTSVAEVQNQLIIARDLAYIDKEAFQEVANDSIEVNKLISSLIRSSTTKQSFHTKYLFPQSIRRGLDSFEVVKNGRKLSGETTFASRNGYLSTIVLSGGRY